MRSHAKASSAGSTLGGGSDLGFFDRAFAIRAAGNGVGAPSRHSAILVACFALFAAIAALLAFVPAAGAAAITGSFGTSGVEAGQLSFSDVADTSPGGVAFNSTGNGSGVGAGDVYVADRGNHRIEQFTPEGTFVRAWGYDVVRSGPSNNGLNEQQTVTVPGSVTGGTFKLTLNPAKGEGKVFSNRQDFGEAPSITELSYSFGSVHVGDILMHTGSIGEPQPVIAVGPDRLTIIRLGSDSVKFATVGDRILWEARETTAPIPYNAPASGPGSVQEALEALPGIDPGDVAVSGGPGASAPFTIAFTGGDFDGNDMPQIAATSSLTGGGASVATAVQGGGFEICEADSSPPDACKAGSPSADAGGMSSPQGVAVDQGTGNVFVTDQGNRRVDVFGANGAFQGAFGWGADTGAGAFEFCTAASTCQAPAAAGGSAGQFGAAIGHPAIAPAGAPDAGNLLIADKANNRVDEFSLAHSGETVTGASFVRGIGRDTIPGGTTGLEACTIGSTCKAGIGQSLTGIAVDASGAIYTVGQGVQKLDAAASAEAGFAPAQLGASARAIAVDPASGEVYVVKANESPAEYRVLRFDSAGNLLETSLAGVGIGQRGPYLRGGNLTPALGIAFDPSSGRALFSTSGDVTNDGRRREHLFVLGSPPPLAAETLSVSLDDPAATAITEEGATVRGTVAAAQGIQGHTRYQFEYTNGTTWSRTPLRDAGNGLGAGDPTGCPLGNPPSCEVSEQLDLEAGQDYKLRLRAFLPFNPDLSATTPIVKFKTTGVLPTAKTGNAWWSSPAETKPNLMFTGFVNPRNEVTNYYFQYVSEEEFLESGYANAQSTPAPPGDPAAQSFNTVEVQHTVYEAEPSPTYHYRLVAVNPSGTSFGEDRTIEPPQPSDRFYELVSAGDSGGLSTSSALQLSDQGDRVLFASEIMDEPTALPTPANPKVAQRTTTGWKIFNPAIDPDYGYVGELGAINIGFGYQPSADLSSMLFEPTPGNPREDANRRLRYWLADIAGSFEPATPLLEALTREPGKGGFNPFGGEVQGASADLSQIAFMGNAGITLLPGEPLIPQAKPYVADTETLELNMLNVDTAGKMIGGVCGASVGGGDGRRANAVSLDGSAMYFSARPGTPLAGLCNAATQAEFRTRVFKRENGTTTEVSASQCNRPALPEPPGPCKAVVGDDSYQGASADGSVVFFGSPRQLADSDLDSGQDLYAYDSTPPPGQPTLVQATAGEVTAGHPTVGSGAEFIGVVDMASDGSRVYFVAKGQLTAGATAGQNNLYVFERDEAQPSGRIGFLGTLASGDANLWGTFGKEVHALPSAAIDADGAQTYGDGRFLVFTAVTKLLPEDTDSAKDLYRYADETGQLLCLSCVGNDGVAAEIEKRAAGVLGSSNPGASQQGRVASEDGSKVVFQTEEGLVPGDQNGVRDAYLWDEGQLVWISRDAGELGSGITSSNLIGEHRPIVSLDGKDVYFTTEARLVPFEVDSDAAPDLYSARIGGGFPAPKPEARICVDGEVCRGETTAAPPLSTPASSSVSGPGNQVSSKPRCRKGKVRRKGRCVKAKAKKQKQRKAHRNARGSK